MKLADGTSRRLNVDLGSVVLLAKHLILTTPSENVIKIYQRGPAQADFHVIPSESRSTSYRASVSCL